MEIEQLLGAIQCFRNRTPAADSRAATYLRTYPAMLLAARSDLFDDATRLLYLSTMVYGWMPRVLRLDADYIAAAASGLRQARLITEPNCPEDLIRDVAGCLSSIVGASKMLHFVNPEIFPIWDSNVERIHSLKPVSQHHMQQARNYAAYFNHVHALRRSVLFPDFFEKFNSVYRERLTRLGIEPYQVTEARAIEAAAFELSGSDAEGA